MQSKQIVLLGSTGSIGVQTLEVAQQMGWRVLALTANQSVEKMEQQVRAFCPLYAVMQDEKAAADLAVRLADTETKVLAGLEGICTVSALPQPCVVVNAVVGMIGLQPTLAAIEAGHDVALANKETLVAGGALVMQAARRKGVHILPIDSEHSAIFQCLQASPQGCWAPPDNRDGQRLARLILTASGGPFFGKRADELQKVTLQQALQHPNWSMGAKITVDSATMMNKGLELIEARWLFDVAPDQIDVVIHRESIIHSMIEFIDGSTLAQMGNPDMRVPIRYALTYPDRIPSAVKPLNLAQLQKLTFFEPDHEAFPCLEYCRAAIAKGGMYPVAVNAANERANELFRQGKIGFTDIARSVERALADTYADTETLENILNTDRECRLRVRV